MTTMRSDPIEITVTANDIACGVREDCGKCPIALAVKRAFPLASEVSADYGAVSFYHVRQVFYADQPESVDDWMCSFDQGKDVAPFSFAVTFEITERDAEQGL